MSDPDKTARLRPAIRILLLISLALNLVVIGLVAGALVSGRVGDRPRLSFELGPFVRALDPEDRRAIIETIRSDPDVRPPSPRERRRKLVEMVQILRTEPFDPAAMEQLLAEQRDQGQRIVSRAHSALVMRLSEVSPAERAAFADRLESETRRGPSERDGPREGRE